MMLWQLKVTYINEKAMKHYAGVLTLFRNTSWALCTSQDIQF